MKKLILFASLILFSFLLPAQVNFQSWDVYQTIWTSQSSGRNILVSFEASWCQPCQWMKKNIYQTQFVADKINREYLAIKSDMDQSNEWSTQYKVEVLPYTMILDAQGNKIADLKGTATVSEFTTFLECKCQVKAPPAAIPVYASMSNNIESEADRYWTIQIGKYVGPFYANRLKNRASQRFEDVHILYEKDRYGKDIYRVFVGLFADENTAKYTLGILRDQGYKGFTKYL